jgi:hypothetical protein
MNIKSLCSNLSMLTKSSLRKNLLKLILTATIAGCISPSNEKNAHYITISEKSKIEIPIKLEEKNKTLWKDVAEYDAFVRSTINKYYISDVEDVYNFYNIKRDLPKYGFKAKNIQTIRFDCEGAVYKEGVDSIYFYSTCLKELFNSYIEYHEKDENDIKEELTNRIHHYIKHEAAHAFYYKLGKELGEKYLFKDRFANSSTLEDIQTSLIEEGVADYISYKGELTEPAKNLSDKDLKDMIEKEDDYNLYYLGFLLVKPILDINFEKGIEELIKNPLSNKNLNDLPAYREKRIENLLK